MTTKTYSFPGLALCACLLTTALPTARAESVASPSNTLELIFDLKDGTPHYELQRFSQTLIKPSPLGLKMATKPDFSGGFKVVDSDIREVDETWEQPWGEQQLIRNYYRELKVSLADADGSGRRMNLFFRVYDDGMGFRYEIPAQEGVGAITLADELTEFRLTGDHRSWSIGAFKKNRYEYQYTDAPLSETEHDSYHTPLTLVTGNSTYLSIHEAALTDYSSMALTRGENHSLKASLFPWADGTLVKKTGSLLSPWRTIQVADTPGGLIENHLILNLNEPCVLEDTSWIKPSKYVGIWWEMHLGTSTWEPGEKHGATTLNTKRYIDFAAKHGFDGVLVEGWNTGWDRDWINDPDFSFTTPCPDYDLPELTRYAQRKGVHLIGHHETGGGVESYEGQLEPAFAHLARHGIPAVKTGYVSYRNGITHTDEKGEKHGEWHHGQFMVRHYRRVIETAARHKVMLNVHEPIKDTGLRRTYPHMLTREGAQGQEFNAWGGEDRNRPDHTTIIPFTRMLAGPMDFTPGIFDLTFEGLDKEPNRVSTTLAKQLALYVVLYSPLHMAADLPENYEKHPTPFQFIKDVPVDWSESKVLAASIGDHVTIARKDRNSDQWFLGSITDEHGRVLDIPLGFLDRHRSYTAEIYRDGPDAHWETNPYPLEFTTATVTANDRLPLRLAAGGGTAVRFVPQSTNTVSQDP